MSNKNKLIGNNATGKLCITRALQNANYLQSKSPDLFDKKKPLTTNIPLEHLMSLHLMKPEQIQHKSIADQLAKTKIPLPRDQAIGSLFNGTLYFVQVTFNGAGAVTTTLNTADIQTAIQYATLAVNPIAQYARYYGTNIGSIPAINVSPTMLSFEVNVTSNTYTDNDLQGWVDQIVSDNGLSSGSGTCIVVMNDISGPVQNSDADPSQVGGYHFNTSKNTPYCFCNVYGTSLTIDDRQANYAGVLSHETAEMTVDPVPSQIENPEVCDPCAPNCQGNYFTYFDGKNNYLGGLQTDDPTSFGQQYTYYINSIVSASYPLHQEANGPCIARGRQTLRVFILQILHHHHHHRRLLCLIVHQIFLFF